MAFTQGSTESVGQLLSTSLYDFDFRKYAQAQGRWISPDPAGMAAADPTNPQSWNRYAYVLNNPLVNVDPLGLFTTAPCPIMTIRTGGICANINQILIPGCYVNLLYEGGFGGIGCGSSDGTPNTNSSSGGGAFTATNIADGILRGNNPCSSFFNDMVNDFIGGSGSTGADMFESDNVQFNNNSIFTTYAATSTQGAGAGTTIGVQINSPWTFPVKSGADGVPMIYSAGPFVGGTVQAQTVFLFHELAHTINYMTSPVFPPDSDNKRQSYMNTHTIVNNCAATIQAVTQ